MNRNPYLLAHPLLGVNGRQLPKSLERFFRPCENRACRKRTLLRSLRIHDADGIRMQGQWYCCAECFEHVALDEFLRLLATSENADPKRHRMPIGLLMLSRGMISDAQLKRALTLQREKGQGRIGEFLRSIHAATDEDIAVGLAAQWGCPVYPLDRAREFLECSAMLPMELLESGSMLPVHHTRLTGTLHLAFVKGVDRTALYAVEQMLHLKTLPCIVSESSLLRAFEELQNRPKPATAVFDGPLEAREMVRTTRSYAWQVGARDVLMARSGPFIWIRLQTAQSARDILFHAAPRAR